MSVGELRESIGNPPLAGAFATTCLNCGAVLRGAFCADCGQRAVPPHPTLGELAGDAFGELTGWDGKFIETFRLLIQRPGELTRQFIGGRRVRFISPVRLYLTLSLVYFVIAASAPNLVRPSELIAAAGISIGVTTTSGAASTAPERAKRAVADAQQGALTAAERDAALADAKRAPRIVRPIIERSVTDPAGFRRSMIENMPRALFALLPVFAAIVGLFYRGRHYPEHLYFAIHFHSFVFLALLGAQLAKFTHSYAVAHAAGVVAFAWVIAYAIMAFRRMYGGSIAATVAKGAGIGVLYLVPATIGMFALVWWAAVFP